MRIVKRATELPLLRLLVYGPPGSGKTPLCASFNTDPRTGPTLLVDMAGRPETAKFYDPSLRVVALDTIQEINDIYSFFYQGQPDNHKLRGVFDPPLEAGEKFKTLALDTFTAYQQYSIAWLVGGVAEVRNVKDLTEVPAPSDIRHWGKIAPNTVIPASAFCDLPVNVVFTLQEYGQLDIKTGVTKRKPQLSGQAADIVPAYFNMTALMTWETPPAKTKGEKPSPEILMTWKLNTREAYATKQDWIRGIGEDVPDGMWSPSATKLFDLAEKFHQKALNK